MDEKKIKMRLEQLREIDPEVLIEKWELLLRSAVGRVIDIMLFSNITPSETPIDNKNERFINTLSIPGGAVLQAQRELLEENESLNIKMEEISKIVKNGGKVSSIFLNEILQTGKTQKEEMELLKKFLRIEIDLSCGTATIGLEEEEIDIKKGLQITIPINPQEKVLQFPAQS